MSRAGPGQRILVVDDEPAIGDSVSYALEREGYSVARASDGATALELAAHEAFDATVLDVMLPDLSGTEVCRRLRERGDTVPVVMLTVLGEEVDRVVGLEAGADDYVAKPFSMPELLARVRAVLRRRELDRSEHAGRHVRVGTLDLDATRHVVTVDGAEVVLTPSEFRLLWLLASEPERGFTREEIVRHLWESDFAGTARACDAHVVNLRRKIEHDPGRPERLLTVRGIGYKLVPV